MCALAGFLLMLCMLQYSEAALTLSGPGTPSGATTTTSVAETSTAGVTLFTLATAGGTGTNTYTFETGGNPSDVASTTITAGAVTLATLKSIDFETTKSLTFIIKAVDSTPTTPLTATVTVTLSITNKLEFAKAKYGVCATDGATAGTAIATYVVADAATGDTVGYTITAGNAAGDLAVGATTGALTVATGKTLSQTTTGGYTITITATATVTTGTASAVGTTEVWVAICSTTCSGVGHVTALIGVLLLGLLAACNI